MGQQASKGAAAAAQRAARAAAATAAEAPPPPSAAAASKQVPVTHPSNTGRFQRGQASHNVDPRDAGQQDFLRRRAGGPAGPVEMPDDLVRFLRDAGPLQKKKAGGEDAGEKKKKEGPAPPPLPGKNGDRAPASASSPPPPPSRAPSSQRRREVMPLASGVEGFGTERTTNFSYDDGGENEDPSRLRPRSRLEGEAAGSFDVVGMYRILASKELREHQETPPSFGGEDGDADHDPAVRQRILDARRYLEVPVIVTDPLDKDDGGYLGVHPRKLGELRVDLVPKTEVVLVLEDLADQRDREEGRLKQ